MTNPLFSSDTPGVLNSAGQISGAAEQIATVFTGLTASGDAVIRGSWTGSAAESLHEGWTQWQQGMRKVIDALDEMSTLVAGAAKTFHAQDQGGDRG